MENKHTCHMTTEQRLIDANAIPESATAISTDGRLFVAWSAIVDAPTVDAVEVVHGRWIHKGAWHIECSECQYIHAHIGEAKNYCPNCGAKMDGGNKVG